MKLFLLVYHILTKYSRCIALNADIVSEVHSFSRNYVFTSPFIFFIDFSGVVGLLPGRSTTVYKQVFEVLDRAAEWLNLTFQRRI